MTAHLLLPAATAAAATRVARHTRRADAALARAVSLLEAGRERPALAALARSRGELSRAATAADGLLRRAGTPAGRAAAATAVRLVAAQRHRNLSELAGMLSAAGAPAADRAIAQAVLIDTKARDTAVGVLRSLLLTGLPPGAEAAVATAIAAISTERRPERNAAAAALANGGVSPAAAATVTRAIDQSVRGQARAEAILGVLLGKLPEAARPGVQRSLQAIAGEREGAAGELARVSAHGPAAVRAQVAPMLRWAEGAATRRAPAAPAAGVRS